MSLLSKIFIFFVTCILIVNTGCRGKVYNQAQGNIADATSRSEQALKKSDIDAKKQPALVVNPGLYVDKTPINLAKEPSWLKSNIIIRGENLPFSYYSRATVNGGDQNGQIARVYSDYKGTYKDYKSMAGVPVVLAQPTFPGEHTLTRYQIGLDPAVKFSMNYSGSVKGALDLIAAKTGYVYSIDGNNIYWQAFITKTFDIAFMPGSSDYLMGKSTGAGSSSSSGSSGGGGGSGGGGSGGGASSTVTTGFLDDSSTAQYSSLKGTLSVWKDLEATIKQLLSPGGTVVISEATTSVTVRDRPSNLELVSNFIENFNKTLSSQVLIKVEILDITLNDDFNFGINWQAVQQNIGKGTQFVLSANNSAPITIASLTSGAANPSIGLQPQRSTDFIAPLITALQQQGRVSVVSEPRVVTLNNQVASIRIVNQQGYLAALQITSFGTSSSSTTPTLQNQVTSQVTPGTVITGLTLYILPKILNKKIYLQVNADLSTLNQLGSISSTGIPSTATAPQPSIQVPNITQKQFNQRSVLASGDTMVLSGFKQITNRANTQELFNSADLGGRAAQQANTETIVLITPIILYGCA